MVGGAVASPSTWLSQLPPSSSSCRPRSKAIVLPAVSSALRPNRWVAGMRTSTFQPPATATATGLDGNRMSWVAEIGDAAIGVDRVLVGIATIWVEVIGADKGQLDLVVVPDVGAVVDDGVGTRTKIAK